jgi:hypothetical protein
MNTRCRCGPARAAWRAERRRHARVRSHQPGAMGHDTLMRSSGNGQAGYPRTVLCASCPVIRLNSSEPALRVATRSASTIPPLAELALRHHGGGNSVSSFAVWRFRALSSMHVARPEPCGPVRRYGRTEPLEQPNRCRPSQCRSSRIRRQSFRPRNSEGDWFVERRPRSAFARGHLRSAR